MNVGYVLANSAAKFPDKEAIVCDQGRMSFAVFENRVACLAGAMRASGLTRGERVALLFYNGGPFVETYFAAIRVGLVATPVNFRFVGEEIRLYFERFRCGGPVSRSRISARGRSDSSAVSSVTAGGLS